jgi:DNA-binding CsgD family transcriptional regulator
MIQTTLSEIFAKVIRDKVKGGKTKIEVANELGVSYYMVKKHTKNIHTKMRIPIELEQRIREEVKKRKTKRQVAKELNISRDTVIKYTKDILINPAINRKRSPELIKKIRANVRKFNSKSDTARKMGLSYYTVIWYTQDIPINRGISTKVKERIRNEVKKGKLKTQVAREMGWQEKWAFRELRFLNILWISIRFEKRQTLAITLFCCYKRYWIKDMHSPVHDMD